MKEMAKHFFMREGFDKFHLEPVLNRKVLIGKHDRNYRDAVLFALEEGSYGMEGYKGVIYGDFGRGKTHEANNIIWEIERRQLPLWPVYVRCHEFKSKEPFSSLFSILVAQIGLERINEVAREYEHREKKKEAAPIRELVGSDEIATAFKALSLPNTTVVRRALQWLGGVPKVDTESIGEGLTAQLSLSRDFASVMTGMAHMFKVVDNRLLLFIVDEAERLSLITHTDTYWSWVACLRSLTELNNVGLIFYVAAKTKDMLPNMLTWDEVFTRIGSQNYRDLLDPGPDDLRQWIEELFQTVVRKGPVPEAHVNALGPPALDEAIPPELLSVIDGDMSALPAYPFKPSALSTFVTQCVTQELANRPREVLKRIQSAAKRAMRHDKHIIDETILAEVQGDGW